MVPDFFWNSGTVVRDRYYRVPRGIVERDYFEFLVRVVFSHCLRRIENKIEYKLLKLNSIAAHEKGRVTEPQRKFDIFLEQRPLMIFRTSWTIWFTFTIDQCLSSPLKSERKCWITAPARLSSLMMS